MESDQQVCILCSGTIDILSLSFEQRLIGDKDFCRKCWNEIMIEGYDEFPVPILQVVRGGKK